MKLRNRGAPSRQETVLLIVYPSPGAHTGDQADERVRGRASHMHWRRGAFLIIGCAFTTTACAGGNDETAARSPSAEAPVTPTTPPSVTLGGDAWGAVYGFGGVWIQVDPPVDQVVKVDEVTGKVAVRIDRGATAAIAQDAVWVATGTETQKIDPITGTVLLASQTPGASYVAVGAGGVWVPNPDGVTRLDPLTGAAVARTDLDVSEVTEIAASDDAVWVTDKVGGTVTRIDPATNEVVAKIKTGYGAHHMAIDEHGVWIANYKANTVSRIDPATNRVVATIDHVGSGVGITTDGESVYVSTKYQGISRIDPDTNTASPVAEFAEWNYGLAYGSDELWVTSVDQERVYRMDAASLD
jgi:YVTN family beta-propeller protein